MGEGFLQVLQFPLPGIPPTAVRSSSRAVTIGHLVASLIVDSDPLHPTRDNIHAKSPFHSE
jgi:hypothetical protein